MKPNRICLLVGKRGTGKSTLLEDVMYHYRHTDMAVAMTPTEDSAAMFRQHLPEAWIHNCYAASQVDRIIAVQRELGRRNKHRGVLLALDDCLYDKKILRTTSIRDIFMNGRHLRLSVLIACQYVMDMGPDLRTQCDYVFALRENIISNKAKLWKYFFGMFDKYDDFSRVMDHCTENYSCLVLDNTCKTNRLEDCLFWYRADAPRSFQVGSPVFLQMANRYQKSPQDREDAARDECEAMAQAQRARGKNTRITCVQRTDANGAVIKQ